MPYLDVISTTFELTVMPTGSDFARTHARHFIELMGMGSIGKKGIAPWMHSVTDSDRTRVTSFIEVVGAFTDLAFRHD